MCPKSVKEKGNFLKSLINALVSQIHRQKKKEGSLTKSHICISGQTNVTKLTMQDKINGMKRETIIWNNLEEGKYQLVNIKFIIN